VERAYSVPVPLSSPWLPGSHAPRPPPAPPSRQSPPTPLTSLTLSRIPKFAQHVGSCAKAGMESHPGKNLHVNYVLTRLYYDIKLSY